MGEFSGVVEANRTFPRASLGDSSRNFHLPSCGDDPNLPRCANDPKHCPKRTQFIGYSRIRLRSSLAERLRGEGKGEGTFVCLIVSSGELYYEAVKISP